MPTSDDRSTSLPGVGSTPDPAEQKRRGDARARVDVYADQRRIAQIGYLVERISEQGTVQVCSADGDSLDPPQWGRAAYIVRQGRIFCSTENAPAVARTLGLGETTGEPTVVDGIVSLDVPDTMEALRKIEAEHGRGFAAPEHVLQLCPSGGITWCPATEPLVPGRVTPTGRRRSSRRCDGHGVTVAVVDNGFDHGVASVTPWLAGVDGDQETLTAPVVPYQGHGTFVAGVVRCVAPAADVYVHGVMASYGSDFEFTLIEKLQAVIATKPDIVCLPAGTITHRNDGLFGFDTWWRANAPKGTVLVAAAGNNGNTTEFYPAAAGYALGVGATGPKGFLAHFSNRGPWVDVYARGADVVNAFPIGDYHYMEPPMAGQPDAHLPYGLARWSGTSFATPLVCGVIAAQMSSGGRSARSAKRRVMRLANANRRKGVGPVVVARMACEH